jgi:hypothetical protein
MALPVILVDSATGSDSAASGAGPATALTGTAAASDVAGTLITLDGSPDLSGVATDGSAVLWFNDTASGAVTFTKITATDNGADTVTVTPAVTGSLSGKTWAIGGKRASIFSTTSNKLLERTGSNIGDLLAGWAIEMASGHTESSGGSQVIRAVGTTAGRIEIRGVAGAATKPKLTFTNNGAAITLRTAYCRFRNFEMVNTNATKTLSKAFVSAAGCTATVFEELKIADSTDNFYRGISMENGQGQSYIRNEIGYCANTGITSIDSSACHVIGNYIHDTGSHGLVVTANSAYHTVVAFNIFDTCTTAGVSWGAGGGVTRGLPLVTNNTFYNTQSGSGLVITTGADETHGLTNIINNIFANNSAYGINYSNGAVTEAYANALGITVSHNAFYSNTSGTCNPSGLSVNEQTVDPQFVDAANGDFRIGDNLKALGFPGVMPGGLSTGYMDIGAMQRIEGSGGGGSILPTRGPIG